MPRLKATIEYDGTGFCGWQIQPGQRTVQGVLQEILNERFSRTVKVYGSGRTDSGVHATGQVAHFNTPKDTDPASLTEQLNSMLPPDITVRSLDIVPITFHARYHAVSRTYRYVILTEPSALLHRYGWFSYRKLNAAAMNRAAATLLGTHDFKPLVKLKSPQKHYLCTVFSARVTRRKQTIVFTLRANRFLHGMVRALTGTLADVGRGRRDERIFTHIFETQDRELTGELAPAHGLYLDHVQYQDMELIKGYR